MHGPGNTQSPRTEKEHLNRSIICLVIFAGGSNTS